MPDELPDRLEIFLGGELRRRAPELGEEWLRRLSPWSQLDPFRLSSGGSLAEVGAAVAGWMASYLGTGIAAVDPGVVRQLRNLARLRREQGASLEELLIDLEVLAKLVSEAFARAVCGTTHPLEPARLMVCCERLREGLAAVSLTATRLFQREVAEQNRELSKRLEEFGYTVVHELKNPLSNIQLGAELLLEQFAGTPDDELGQCLIGIQQAAGRAMNLLDDVRVLALAEGARGEARRMELRTLLDNVLLQVRASAARNGVSCEVREPVPDAEVDGVQVGIILINLVGNAIKYADPAKPERWVRVGVERVNELVHGWKFTVADNGLGIPRELQGGVFRRHFRAHSEVAEGTGLGLAITRQMIEQRGGQIWFQSERGRGTTFHFVLPDRSGRRPAESLPPPLPVPLAAGPLSR